MKVNANGINFNCQIDGPEGAPWIIFSNSLITNLSMWDDQVAGLKNEFRILRYDQRGHGGTDAPAGKYSFDTLTKDGRSYSNLRVSNNGATAVLTIADGNRPADVYVGDGDLKNLRRIVESNPQLAQKQFGPTELLSYLDAGDAAFGHMGLFVSHPDERARM